MTLHSIKRGDKTSRTRENIFLEHYSWLLERSRHLVVGSAEDPQDLVQELYINFVQLEESPSFNDPSHEQAYLRKALKNLFTSRRLRQGKDASTRLALVDFDSLESALIAVDRGQLFNVRRDLARIAEYSILRRTANRGATVFIMRFFFGYLPSEIMALLKINRKTFEKMLLRARLEAQAYVERPHVLRFIKRQDKSIPAFPNSLPEETESLFAELQRRMFFESVGSHEVFPDLAAIYSTFDQMLSLEQTAHLGSCRICLHQAGQVIGIPDLLLQLFPDPTGPGDSASGSRGIERDRLKKLRRKGQEVFEHRPSKLQIIVDGQLRNVQAVTAAESRLQLTLKPLSRPEFVEIRSEQGVPMLYFDLQRGAELLETREAFAEFSEGRTLSATFHFTDGSPVIEVCYYDPLLEHPEEDRLQEEDVFKESPETPTITSRPRRMPAGGIAHWLIEMLRHFPGGKWGGAATVVFVLLATIFSIKREKVISPILRRPSASQLIAVSQENSLAAIPNGGGIHAIYTLDRRSSLSSAVTSERVEVMRSKSDKQSILRLRSSAGTLLDDRRSDERGAIHATDHVPHTEAKKSTEDSSPLWTHVPDVRDFLVLAGNASITVSSTTAGYELGFRHTATASGNGVLDGRIELTRSALHPVSEDLHVQEENSQTTYRFVEVSYDVLSAEVFQRQYQNQGSSIGGRIRPQQDVRDYTPSLILHALEVIDESHDAEDTIELERLPLGAIRLNGVVSTDMEKRTLIRRLRDLEGARHLLLDIHSSQEATENTPSIASGVAPHITSVEAVQQPVPWLELLRNPSSRGTAISTYEQDALNRTARRLVSDGARFHREVWLNACLTSRWFTVAELRSLSPQEQHLWAVMVWKHLSSADSALRDIIRVLDSRGTDAPRPDGPITDVVSFAEGSERLRQSGERLDRLLSTGFTLSTSPATSTAVSSELLPLLAVTNQLESQLIHVAESLR